MVPKFAASAYSWRYVSGGARKITERLEVVRSNKITSRKYTPGPAFTSKIQKRITPGTSFYRGHTARAQQKKAIARRYPSKKEA